MVPRFSQILGLGSGVFREALRHARANLGDFAALKVLAFEKHASANCGPARSGFITLILICRGHSPCQKRELELRRCRYKSVQQRLKSLLTLERLSCQWETWPVSTLSFEWLKAFNAFNSLQVRPHPMRTWEKGRVCTSRESRESRVANLRSSSAELRIDRGQRLTAEADRWLRWLVVWWGNVGSFSSEEIMSGLNLLISYGYGPVITTPCHCRFIKSVMSWGHAACARNGPLGPPIKILSKNVRRHNGLISQCLIC